MFNKFWVLTPVVKVSHYLLSLSFLSMSLAVSAQVTPAAVDKVLAPGKSFTVNKKVETPEMPARLDVCLIVDNTGSYADDIANIKSKASDIWDGTVAAAGSGAVVRFGLATFRDFPFGNWGESDDYAYRLEQSLTADKTTWITAINDMDANGGNDEPESQYEAIFQAVTGAGLELGVTIEGEPGTGDIPADMDCGFDDPDAFKVILLTTDASFHNPGDTGAGFPYPGSDAEDVISALNDNGVTFIALKAPGSTTQMDDLANATGGTVVATSSDSSDIVTAISGAIGDLTYKITATPASCEPLNVSFDPAVHEDVPGGATVEFTETIAVPKNIRGEDLSKYGKVHCTVEFRQNDALIGEQKIWIKVKRSVKVDILPHKHPNIIKLYKRGKGIIPVAILGSKHLSVRKIKLDSLRFGSLRAKPINAYYGHYHYWTFFKDINKDGYLDLISFYKTKSTGIEAGDTKACIKGRSRDKIRFMGCDSVKPVKVKRHYP